MAVMPKLKVTMPKATMSTTPKTNNKHYKL
jgi:hypothetical protein